jgi:hypothetical protein
VSKAADLLLWCIQKMADSQPRPKDKIPQQAAND